MVERKFRLQITSYKFKFRQTFCTSLSSVEIHFQSNRYFTTFIVFSTSMLFIYLCATFIKRIIHNLICFDALCMRNNVQCTLYMNVLYMNVTPAYYLCSTGFRNCRVKFYNVYGVPALDKRNYHSIHSHDTLVFWMNLHTNTFCKYRKNYAHRLACILCYI